MEIPASHALSPDWLSGFLEEHIRRVWGALEASSCHIYFANQQQHDRVVSMVALRYQATSTSSANVRTTSSLSVVKDLDDACGDACNLPASLVLGFYLSHFNMDLVIIWQNATRHKQTKWIFLYRCHMR
jgi:hypothetical protein